MNETPSEDVLTPEQATALALQVRDMNKQDEEGSPPLRFHCLNYVCRRLELGHVSEARYAYYYDRDKLETSGQDICSLLDSAFGGTTMS